MIQEDLEDLKQCIVGNCEKCGFVYGSRKCIDYQTDVIDDAVLELNKQAKVIWELMEEVRHGRKV